MTGSPIDQLRSLGIDEGVLGKLAAVLPHGANPRSSAPPQPAPGSGTPGDTLARLKHIGVDPQIVAKLEALLSGQRPQASAQAVPQAPQLAPGAAMGGIFKKVRSRLGDLLEGTKDKAGEGIDWYERNVQDPAAGYGTALTGGVSGILDALPGVQAANLASALTRGEPIYQPRRPTFDILHSPEKMGKKFREEEMGGVERLGNEVLFDPLTFAGGYGKAVSKLPALGKVGKGISAVESMPGKAVDKALTGTGKAVGKALPEVLTRPSVAERSRQAGDLAFDKARLAGKSIDQASAKYESAASKARRGIEKTIRSERDAAKKAGGMGGAWASAQDTLSKLYQEGVDVAGVTINPSSINRNLAVASLSNPQYVIGSPIEDTARALLGGGSGRRADVPEFWKALEGVPGVPADLVRSGRTAAMTGTSKTTGSKLGDLIGGRTATKITEGLTSPIHRGFVLDQYAKEAAKGTAPAQAMTKAVAKYRREFPTPAGETNLDVSAKAVMPFWNYQSKRFPYLLRKGSEFPGLPSAYSDYMDATDNGYVPVNLPGGLQVNPLRGSAVSAVAGLTRDQPPYTRGFSGKVEELQNLAGRGGFYGGAIPELAIQGARFLEGEPTEFGAIVPDTAWAPLTAAEALGAVPGLKDIPGIHPLAAAAGRFRGAVATDRFDEYQVAKELAAAGIEPERATHEQRAEASQRAAARGLLMTEAGNLRYRPQAEQQFKAERQAAAIEAGIPEDVVQGMKGNPVSAVDPTTNQPYLNAVQKRDIYDAHPDWEKWTQVSNPLRHPDDQRVNQETSQYYDTLEGIDAQTGAALRQLYERAAQGVLSGEQFREQRRMIFAEASAARDQVTSMAGQRGALVDDESRAAFAKQTGRELVGGDRPEDTAARQFYQIEPEIDSLTGAPMWDQFFSQREQYLASLDPTTRDYVQNRFPARRWAADPVVASGEQWYRGVQEQMREYFDMPKYLGLSPEDTRQVEEAQRAVQVVQMMNPGLDTKRARYMVMAQNPELATGVMLMRLASRLRNPEREMYLDQNPQLRWLLGSVALGIDPTELDAEGDPRLGPAAGGSARSVGAAGGGAVGGNALGFAGPGSRGPHSPQPRLASWQQQLGGILTR